MRENPLASASAIHSLAAVNCVCTWSIGRAIAHALTALMVICACAAGRAYSGFDAGESAACVFREVIARKDFPVSEKTWLRVRNLGLAMKPSQVKRERAALLELKRRGYRIVALVEWPKESWAGGVRAGAGGRFPLDLREAWTRSRELGRVYADYVDVWEIGNEPDVSFLEDNAETYAAYLKACRAGLRASVSVEERKKLRVLMAPLALPPGPYFEGMWANGVGAATDGFNFHYYGYSEDFSDVYVQFRDAVEQMDGKEKSSDEAVPTQELPVFLTEYGYGLLSVETASTQEGRLRQWRWFRDVGRQLDLLRPEGALAFVLRPYSEQALNEFGLIASSKMCRPAQAFGPSDFELSEAEPWMAHVGMKTGWGRISPTLAWLLRGKENTSATAASQTWRARMTTEPEGIVLDFVARDGLEQRKSFGGYFARGIASDGSAAGWGELVLYNFSDAPMSGVLQLGAGLALADGEAREERLTLAVDERRAVTVRVRLSADVFVGVRSKAVFVTEGGARTQLSTTLWPDPSRMVARVELDFSRTKALNEDDAQRLQARSRASEEPALRRDGRWLVSTGTRVEEREGRWRFLVEAMPKEPLRPAMAELVLPAHVQFEPGRLLEFAYRLGKGSADKEAWLDVYFRTENGNLYHVWPRLRAGPEWRGYAEAWENFTMAFYGRAKLPWRFSDNRPVALVFFMRPTRLPAIYEVEKAAITQRVVE
jgi:hypothetical protein